MFGSEAWHKTTFEGATTISLTTSGRIVKLKLSFWGSLLIVILSDAILNAVTLSILNLNVTILIVVMFIAVMLNVIILSIVF
jgi:hypothetical protein